MLHHYTDIVSRIALPPTWWDEHGVPRYCEFEPIATANVYADEAALVEIGCQNCGAGFNVAFTRSRSGLLYVLGRQEYRSIADEIRAGTLHYGDPPNAGCCPSGPTMNCDDRRVLQYWKRERFDWERDSSLEIPLDVEDQKSASAPL